VKKLLFPFVLTLFHTIVQGQQMPFPLQITGQNNGNRPVITAVPFLSITPDAKSAGMGEAGAATSPNAVSAYWNAAKYAFIENDFGGSISVTPWLRKVTNDMSLNHLSFYKKLNDKETVATSLVYFDLGTITLTNTNGVILGHFIPREFALDASYSRKLSKKLSIGGTARFISSNLIGDINASTINLNTGSTANTFAADVSLFYSNSEIILLNNACNFALGLNFSNLGGKIIYANSLKKDHIPTNLRVGSAFSIESDMEHKVTFAFDLNKLMVPTPPVLDNTGNIIAGSAPSNSAIGGIFNSFRDAPEGAKEELQEMIIASGIEYWYRNFFALRSGYFHEHQKKGNRKYFTLGLGIKYQTFGVDFAYLVPTQRNNPLEDTLRFSLLVNFDKKEKALPPKESNAVY